MPTSPAWVYMTMQTTLFLFYVYIAWRAWPQGLHWRLTLVYGTLFGFAVETLCQWKDPSYVYAVDRFLCIGKVPVWVALGWGIVAYACMRAAANLQIPKDWYAWVDVPLRALVAAYLAISIDITLDPIADILGFWKWKCDCGLIAVNATACLSVCPPEPIGTVHLLRYFNVPFDNFFAGWGGIVATYALSFFALSRLTDHRRGVHHNRQPELAPGNEFDASRSLTENIREGRMPKRKDHGVDWSVTYFGPLVAAVISLGLFSLLRDPVQHFYQRNPATGELEAFLVAFFAVGFATAMLTLFTSRQGKVIDWGLVAVPYFFHLVPYLLFALTAFNKQPELLVIVPAALLLSAVFFSWSFSDALIAKVQTKFRTLSTSLGRIFGQPKADAGDAQPAMTPDG